MHLLIFIFISLLGLNALKAQPIKTSGKYNITYKKEDSDYKKKHILLKSAIGIGYASSALFCYKLIDVQEQEESQENKTGFKNNIADLLTPLGDGTVNWIACGSTAGFAYLTKDIRLQKTAVIWAGSLLVSDFFTSNAKSYFQRHRPNTGNPYNTFDGAKGSDQNRSFPSSHTSTAFATATVFASMYKDKKWVPLLAYGMATLVGFSRIYNNAHWASDVMVGAAVGFLSAKGMMLLYKFAEKRMVIIIPQIGQNFSSLKVIYRLR